MKQCEAEMLLSLFETIEKVGGSPKQILTKGLTLDELITILAPNGIRFTVDRSSLNPLKDSNG